jgi:hypothetical protein
MVPFDPGTQVDLTHTQEEYFKGWQALQPTKMAMPQPSDALRAEGAFYLRVLQAHLTTVLLASSLFMLCVAKITCCEHLFQHYLFPMLRQAWTSVRMTRLKDIGGAFMSKLKAEDLKIFCAKHKIGGYKSKSKVLILAELIVAKVVAKQIYGYIGPLGMGDGRCIGNNKKGAKAQERDLLTVVSKTGTYYRMITTWFHQDDNRHLVLQIGTRPPNKNEPDQGGLNKYLWEDLARFYNDAEN